MLGAGLIELRLILELKEEMQRAGEAELLAQPAVDGGLHGLTTPRMAAAAVRPVQRPEPLGGGALLQQQLLPAVEDQQRKGAVQDTLTGMAARLVQVSQFAIGAVHENQRLRIGHRAA